MTVREALKDITIERYYIRGCGSPIEDLTPYLDRTGEIEIDERDFGAGWGSNGITRIKIFVIDKE